MVRITALIVMLVFSSGCSLTAESVDGAKEYTSCSNLPLSKNLNCKDKTAVLAALNELHTCMKSRFTFKEHVYAAAWPDVSVPENGPIVGGDGEWSVGCLNAWPCNEGRLAFIARQGQPPDLVMVSGNYIVGYDLNKVYDAKELTNYSILKVSGLTPDEAWFKVDE